MNLTDDQMKIVDAFDINGFDWPANIEQASFSVEVNTHPFQWIICLLTLGDEYGNGFRYTVTNTSIQRPERDCCISIDQFVSATKRPNNRARLAVAQKNLGVAVREVINNDAQKIKGAFDRLGNAAKKFQMNLKDGK